MSQDGTEPKLAELAELFPTLSPEELEKAEGNLRRFVDVAIRVCQQVKDGSEVDADAFL